MRVDLYWFGVPCMPVVQTYNALDIDQKSHEVQEGLVGRDLLVVRLCQGILLHLRHAFLEDQASQAFHHDRYHLHHDHPYLRNAQEHQGAPKSLKDDKTENEIKVFGNVLQVQPFLGNQALLCKNRNS